MQMLASLRGATLIIMLATVSGDASVDIRDVKLECVKSGSESE